MITNFKLALFSLLNEFRYCPTFDSVMQTSSFSNEEFNVLLDWAIHDQLLKVERDDSGKIVFVYLTKEGGHWLDHKDKY